MTETEDWMTTAIHESGHNAERRIMPHGPSNGWSAGVKPSGNSA
jgi:hypothetical protein